MTGAEIDRFGTGGVRALLRAYRTRLELVQALSDRWGTGATGQGGKVVWARFDLSTSRDLSARPAVRAQEEALI